jgi:membrane protease YdiL (CAAX protease family)
VSALWCLAFALGARLGVLLPVLAVLAVVVNASILIAVPSVRALLVPRARDIFIGVGVGGFSLAATYGLYPFLRALWPPVVDDVHYLYATLPSSLASLPIVVGIVCAEELLWRGAVIEALRADHPKVTAAVLSSMLYASAQLGLGVVILGVLGVLLGTIWALQAVWTRRLVSSLIAHAIWTVTVFALVPLER